MKLTREQKETLNQRLASVGEPLTYSTKHDEYIVKRGYFYTFGYNEDKLRVAVELSAKAASIPINVTDTTNHWHAWPRDSWFEVRFRVLEPVTVQSDAR